MVLGVTCSNRSALFSVVDSGKVIDSPVDRIEVASLHEASEELQATLEEIGRAVAQIRPQRVVLLLPEQSRFKVTYGQVAPRVALETLVRLACVRAGIPVEVLPRASVRSRLGLPRSGDLSSHVPGTIARSGPYWGQGRDVAALAALSGEVA
jgi:hypothetical protein